MNISQRQRWHISAARQAARGRRAGPICSVDRHPQYDEYRAEVECDWRNRNVKCHKCFWL